VSIHGDPGLRPSSDIDLLVDTRDLERAVAGLERSEYRLVDGDLGSGRRPPLHYGLAHDKGWFPPVELHWRVHWYERRFSIALLERSRLGPGDVRRAEAADELAMLLLFFARDGFIGVRYAADIAAWWDACGQSLAPLALDAIAGRHPALRRALTVASIQAERLVGVPARQFISVPSTLDVRGRLALRLVNWSRRGDRDQVASNRVLVDWLLAPKGGQREFARRFLLPSADSVVRYEQVPEHRRPARIVWRITHGPKVILRSLYALWCLRGGADWAPIPLTHGPAPASTDAGRRAA
jgi:hypothetical protein